jgi:hypothetical protein
MEGATHFRGGTLTGNVSATQAASEVAKTANIFSVLNEGHITVERRGRLPSVTGQSVQGTRRHIADDERILHSTGQSVTGLVIAGELDDPDAAKPESFPWEEYAKAARLSRQGFLPAPRPRQCHLPG